MERPTATVGQITLPELKEIEIPFDTTSNLLPVRLSLPNGDGLR